MVAMSQHDAEAYLSESHVGQLGTVRPDGRPHLTTVRFKWEGERAYVVCAAAGVKARNIRRNPAVVLSVANDEAPFKYVFLEGTAEATKDKVAETATRIAVHYDGPEKGEARARELVANFDMVCIDIKVSRIVGWTDGTG